MLSSHLDEAVLSCWHVLAGGTDVAVIFAGVSEDGRTGSRDCLMRATSSAVRVRERLAEDAGALLIAAWLP